MPFCLRKCHYCDFVSYPYDPEAAGRYREALLQEMALYRERLTPEERRLKTVFIGGGTPTCLPASTLEDILRASRRYFHWLPEVEVTVEANPGTVDGEKLAVLRRAGVNRLSLGVQACQEHLLKLLGRIHTFEQAVEAVKLARRAGFDNLGVDLIFGIPGQTQDQWRSCLEKVLELHPEHISTYSLMIEEGTPLAEAVDEGRVTPCDEELELAMYRQAIHTLTARGYEHYEISSFARPGYRCRHNLTCWQNRTYLGLGPAAHSYRGNVRYYNVGSLPEYRARVRKGELPVEGREQITPSIAMGETVFLGLRLLEGVDLEAFASRFGRRLEDVYGERLERLCRQGLVEISSGHLRLTGRGLPLANRVFAEFV